MTTAGTGVTELTVAALSRAAPSRMRALRFTRHGAWAHVLRVDEVPVRAGRDVSGTVDAVGTGVAGVGAGDRGLGVPDYRRYATAGG
jgi:NADPH:quinone reductase-like Zn-dependent oxidoreductase